MKAAGKDTSKVDHLFECYYGYTLAWPKETCVENAKFFSTLNNHPLKFQCQNINQPVMRMRSADMQTCEANVKSLIGLAAVKTTTSTVTTVTTTTTTTTTFTTTTILCGAGE